MELNQLVMVHSKELVWMLGKVKALEGNKVTLQFEDGKSDVVNKDSEMVLINEKSTESTDDMCKLPELHESLILHNIRQRYAKGIIYTYIGPMIVSVNPYRTIPEYGESCLPDYQQKDRDELTPHLYYIAKKAYQSLINFGNSQAVIISGESGAGKTEATKIVLSYLTAQMGQPKNDMDLAQMILATNPVLEAFGNAKTIRNNNSSRFGKFIKITFDGVKIASARIDNYLLETTRVVFQAPNERNYHIFYQFIRGLSLQEKAKYLVKETCAEYSYLMNGDMMVDGIDDADWFSKTRTSLFILGFSESEVEQIFSLLSAILTLGNITFVGEDQVKIRDEYAFKDFCSLLGVYEGIARQALTVRTLKTRSTAIKVPLSYNGAIENRDALAKMLYYRLFNWLVQKLNRSLRDKPDTREPKFIGILDIYGFEIFEKNSLEQFCINYANEKLHQQFNHHMFKAEQEEYQKEGVPWKEIKFKDNQGCIDLIEKPLTGIIYQLDEEAKVPQGSDEGLLLRLDKKFGHNIWYEHNPRDPDQFLVKHFAGNVLYKITKFLEKNKDAIFPDLLNCCSSSSHEIVQNFFKDDTPEPDAPTNNSPAVGNLAARMRTSSYAPGMRKEAPAADARRQRASVTQKFREELTILVNTLASAERHYVRCIKPNELKSPTLFDSPKVFAQLACNGVFETVTLRKAGFANRLDFATFINRYFVCLGNHPRTKDGINDFCQEFFPDIHDWALGNTKLFMRDGAMNKLQERQSILWKGKALKLQSYIRAFNARCKLAHLYRLFNSACTIQKYIRQLHAVAYYNHLLEEYREKVRRTTIVQNYIRRQQALKIYSELVHEHNCVTCIQKFIRQSIAYTQLEDLREIKRKMEDLAEQKRLVEEYERKLKAAEAERLERERLERERLEQERLERERLEKERLEKEAAALRQKLEEERLARIEEEKAREAERQRKLEEEQAERQRKLEEEQAERKRKLEEEEKERDRQFKLREEELKKQEEALRKKLEEALNSPPPQHPPTPAVSTSRPRTVVPPIKIPVPQPEPDFDALYNSISNPSSPRDQSFLSSSYSRPRKAMSIAKRGPGRERDIVSPLLSPRHSMSYSSGSQTARGPGNRRSSTLVPRNNVPVAPANSGLVFDLPDEDKHKLRDFFNTVGVPVLADHFAQQAVDLETMLSWEDPVYQLQSLGVAQQGVIFRVVRAIDTFKAANGLPLRNSHTELFSPRGERGELFSPRGSTRQRGASIVTPTSPRGSMAQLPTVPAGPSITFNINIMSAYLPNNRAQAGLLSGVDLYVKCEARSFNRRMCNYRTHSCSDGINPNWSSDLAYVPTILQGMSLCFEIWDSSSFMGDRKVGECIWDWHKLQTLNNGQHWLPLKLQGDCIGELLITISNYAEQELEYKWQPDILGGEFESLVLRLLPGAYGPLTATLVRLISHDDNTLGVLYLHSFSDYFFNKELAQSFVDEEYNFYALDLRRYGRSLVPNIHSNWTTTLIEYFEEIHIAIDYMKRMEGIKKVILLGHGLGGLIAVLFAERHHQDLAALCLNSPLLSVNKNWTDFTSKKRGWFGQKGDPLAKHSTFSTFYHQSLNVHHNGEWSWDERLKPIPGFPLFLGWMDMIVEHQKKIELGLNIQIPTLVMISVECISATSWTNELKTADAMINTNKVISVAPKLSPFVKMVLVKNGVHDLFLSGEDAREEAYNQIFNFLNGIFEEDRLNESE